MGVMCACIGLWFGFVSVDYPPAPIVAPINISVNPDYSMRGNVSQYAPNIMEEVVQNRLAWGHIDKLHGLPIAVEDCRLIGKRGVASFDDIGSYAVTVVDCLASHHDDSLFRKGVIFEVGYPTAARFGFAGRGGIWASLEIDQ